MHLHKLLGALEALGQVELGELGGSHGGAAVRGEDNS
jgi:hypothetical protein